MLENEIITKPIVSTEEDKKVISFFDKKDLKGQSFLSWGEHCTECSIPSCFQTCDLYEPRSDGKCRRFTNGIQVIRAPNSHQGFVSKIEFKTWAQLWTPGNTRALPYRNTLEWIYKKFAFIELNNQNIISF